MTTLTDKEENRNLLGCSFNPGIELVHTYDSDGIPRITSPDWARSWPDLTPEDREVLSKIQSADQITSLELVDKWDDDHVACWGLRINGIGLGLWWYDDYLGLESDMQDPKFVYDHLEDVRTRDHSLELLT